MGELSHNPEELSKYIQSKTPDYSGILKKAQAEEARTKQDLEEISGTSADRNLSETQEIERYEPPDLKNEKIAKIGEQIQQKDLSYILAEKKLEEKSFLEESNEHGLTGIYDRLKELEEKYPNFSFKGDFSHVKTSEWVEQVKLLINKFNDPNTENDDLKYQYLQFPEEFGLRQAIEESINDLLQSRDIFIKRGQSNQRKDSTEIFPERKTKMTAI